MKSLLRMVLVVAVVFALTAPAHASIDRAMITVESAASSAGQIVFSFRPEEGDTQQIAIEVEEGASSGKIAKEIRTHLGEALGVGYKVKLADQKVVTIRRTGDAAKFQLTKVEQTVDGTKIYVAFD